MSDHKFLEGGKWRTAWIVLIAILGVVALAGAVWLGVVAEDGRAAALPYTRGELRQVLAGGVAASEPGIAAADLATVAGCPGPAIYDTSGTVQDLGWLADTYGAVSWQCAEVAEAADYVFRLIELRASCGPAVIIAIIKDEDGGPLADRAVIRYWPGAPALPWYDPPASRWTDQGVVGWTSAAGDVGFGLGTGDYYFPPDGGATKIYIADYDGPSDLVEGLGMLGGTEHCTLFPVWQRIAKEDAEPEPETPTPGPLPEGEGLYQINGAWIQIVPVGTSEP